MGKRIAIVTGAGGGIGSVFTRRLLEEDVDEVWAVGRTPGKLLKMKEDLGERVVPVIRDLSLGDEIAAVGRMCADRQVSIVWLVNNAGVARMGRFEEFGAEEIGGAVDINCRALPLLCAACVPFMERGGRILNISSAASFQPLPYLNLYAAAKAFERAYSRALNVELRERGILVTAVCPGWVDTDLLTRECNGRPVKFPGLIPPEKVVSRALSDARRGRDMSVCSLYAKYLHLLARLLPQKTVMKLWLRQIKPYFTV